MRVNKVIKFMPALLVVLMISLTGCGGMRDASELRDGDSPAEAVAAKQSSAAETDTTDKTSDDSSQNDVSSKEGNSEEGSQEEGNPKEGSSKDISSGEEDNSAENQAVEDSVPARQAQTAASNVKTHKPENVDEAVEVSFSWWGNDARHEYTMEGGDIFQKENPDIILKFRYGVWSGYEKRNRVAMQSHTETDVLQVNYAWTMEYSPDGNGYYDLYQLTDYIDITQFDEEALKYGTINGKLIGLPTALNTPELYYNKDVWDSYGLSLPTKWDDFFAAARVMRKDGIYPLGMVKKQLFMFLIAYYEQTYGKEVFLSDGTLNLTPDEMKDLLEYYNLMLKEKVLMPIDDFNRTKFVDGRVAGLMCWANECGNFCDALVDKGGNAAVGGILKMPGSRLSGWYIKPSSMISISKDTNYPVQAARYVNFLMNDPKMVCLQKTEKGVPVSKAAISALEEKGYLGGYEYESARYMNDHIKDMNVIKIVMENDAVIAIFKSCADEYIYNKATLEECAQIVVNKINEEIELNNSLKQ